MSGSGLRDQHAKAATAAWVCGLTVWGAGSELRLKVPRAGERSIKSIPPGPIAGVDAVSSTK
jgi:hypothetical protein